MQGFFVSHFIFIKWMLEDNMIKKENINLILFNYNRSQYIISNLAQKLGKKIGPKMMIF